MRVVLDTNVLVAAFGFGGICRAIVDVCIDSHVLVLSEHILRETGRHLTGKLHHHSSFADQRVALLREAAVVVVPTDVGSEACRDPDDLPVLGTVLAGEADCLVTGDRDLLVLREFGGRAILSPRQFWQRLK
ncbi:MAG TPA: putative toxin-antitoxin system toxin component, PIN family [Phycisphaerae bacterium]|nr:putative toxin-antitoxin system toxin component, PIN family [Phycisphaerae bacterium]